jgi:Fic family protein
MWNWQQHDWPYFRWDKAALEAYEARFLRQAGVIVGAAKHLNEEDDRRLVVELITAEAVKTSAIEGEYLNRDSVQSSILRNFGLITDRRSVSPAEKGIADMMTDLYRSHAEPLSHHTLYNWHKMLTNGRYDLQDIGCYRTHPEPMQVVSGRLDRPTVHFEAPASQVVKKEMDRFIAWFADTGPDGTAPLPALTRAGITHLYFVCIHPFEDGNGRIARALAEKALAQCLARPSLIALAQRIETSRKLYYDKLGLNNKTNIITDWLSYFAKTVLDAQSYSLQKIDFLIHKTKLYDRVRGQLNKRQEKVIKRIFRAGLEGFTGGLSAENYINMTKTSRATATRDLQDLLEKQVLVKTGQLKSTRYYLNMPKLKAS